MGKVGASLQLPYSAETVYRVATRIEDLPKWLPEVVGAELLDTTLALGSRVRLQMGAAAGGSVVTGTVKQLRPPSIVAIGGSADGSGAVVFDFAPQVDVGAEILSRRGEDVRLEEPQRPAVARRRELDREYHAAREAEEHDSRGGRGR